MDLNWGDGGYDLVLDLRNQRITPFPSGVDLTVEPDPFKEWGIVRYYRSISGYSGAAFIPDSPFLVKATTYRVDCSWPWVPSIEEWAKIGEWRVCLPIHYQGWIHHNPFHATSDWGVDCSWPILMTRDFESSHEIDEAVYPARGGSRNPQARKFLALRNTEELFRILAGKGEDITEEWEERSLDERFVLPSYCNTAVDWEVHCGVVAGHDGFDGMARKAREVALHALHSYAEGTLGERDRALEPYEVDLQQYTGLVDDRLGHVYKRRRGILRRCWSYGVGVEQCQAELRQGAAWAAPETVLCSGVLVKFALHRGEAEELVRQAGVWPLNAAGLLRLASSLKAGPLASWEELARVAGLEPPAAVEQ